MDLVRQLRERLARRAPATVSDEAAQRAAVAVVVSGDVQPAILFVKRKVRPGDPWSGQMAFPGGYASPGDDSTAATAERETEEETGLDLAHSGERLGALDDVHPLSVYLPRIVVTPCVFAVPGRPDVVAGPEVDAAVWLTVGELVAAESRHPFELHLPTEKRTFDSIRVEGFTILGMTERILSQLAELVET